MKISIEITFDEAEMIKTRAKTGQTHTEFVEQGMKAFRSVAKEISAMIQVPKTKIEVIQHGTSQN